MIKTTTYEIILLLFTPLLLFLLLLLLWFYVLLIYEDLDLITFGAVLKSILHRTQRHNNVA